MSCLPKDIQDALNKRNPAIEQCQLSIATTETGAIPEECLKGYQRDVMVARAAVLRIIANLEEKFGTNGGFSEFKRKIDNNEFDENTMELIYSANGKNRKKRRTITRITYYRWRRKFREQGEIGLASKDQERIIPKLLKEPAWAATFRKIYAAPGRLSIPETMEEMAKVLPEDVPMPSYRQVSYWNNKRGIERELGRRTGNDLVIYTGHKRRETGNFQPFDLGLTDGHLLKFFCAHPVTGRPVRLWVMSVVDAATRYCTGYSVGLAETAEGRNVQGDHTRADGAAICFDFCNLD